MKRNTMVTKVVSDFAKRVGQNKYRELAAILIGVPFEKAYAILGGYNLDEEEGFFDCNYKCISVTIWKSRFGFCELNPSFDVWHDEISSPICENVTLNS